MKRGKGALTSAMAAALLVTACAVLAGCAAKSCQESKCEKIRLEFSRVLEGAADACDSDEGCAHYPILVNCGGVVDAITAKRLIRLHEEYRHKGCPRVIACEPRLAETPACVNGRCTGRSLRHGR